MPAETACRDKRIQKNPKRSKTLQKNTKESKRFHKIPKEPQKFQKILKESKRIQKILRKASIAAKHSTVLARWPKKLIADPPIPLNSKN